MNASAWIPPGVRDRLRGLRQRMLLARKQRMPVISQERFERILVEELGIRRGGVVFVHSSVDNLKLDFPYAQILKILRAAVGEQGTLVFPSFPKLPTYKFVESGLVFDVRLTPSYMGILTELARRDKDAVRSLHPTRPVCAIGPLAEALVGEHHLSPYPYDRCSPFFKIIEHDGLVVGIGVAAARLSLVHTVDDALGQRFPVKPYLPKLYSVQCKDRAGNSVNVETYAHDPAKMSHDVSRFIRKYISPDVARDFQVNSQPFFYARAKELFDQMCQLAERDITIYPRRAYG